MPETITYRVTRVQTVEFSSAYPEDVLELGRKLLDAQTQHHLEAAQLDGAGVVTIHRPPREESVLIERAR